MAPNTARALEQHVWLHLVPFFGEMDVRAIRVADVQRYHEHCLEAIRPRSKQPLSQTSVATVIGTLRRILAHAQAQELVAANVVDTWKAVRGRRRGGGLQPVDKEKALTADELETLLSVARVNFPAEYPLVLFLADTGCRIGEAIGVRWSDVDLDRGTVRIERSVDHVNRVGPTKTLRSRVVELSTRLREALGAERPHLFGDPDLAFPNEAEGFINSANFRKRVFNRLVRKALGRGRRMTPHSLRHYVESRTITG